MMPLSHPNTTRERRPWTPEEDDLLRMAVNREDPGSSPSRWNLIAVHVPGRTNKDCRKRWYAKIHTAEGVIPSRGGWSASEDQRLLQAIECFGLRWSLVASRVKTRNSDQCAKRWSDTLDPAIDRTAWSKDQDAMLLQAVAEQGKVWSKIVHTYFPGRTGLSAKNRYNSLTRAEDSSRSRRRFRRTTPSISDDSISFSSWSSASSSASTSPLPPTLELDAFDAFSSWETAVLHGITTQPGFEADFCATEVPLSSGLPTAIPASFYFPSQPQIQRPPRHSFGGFSSTPEYTATDYTIGSAPRLDRRPSLPSLLTVPISNRCAFPEFTPMCSEAAGAGIFAIGEDFYNL